MNGNWKTRIGQALLGRAEFAALLGGVEWRFGADVERVGGDDRSRVDRWAA